MRQRCFPGPAGDGAACTGAESGHWKPAKIVTRAEMDAKIRANSFGGDIAAENWHLPQQKAGASWEFNPNETCRFHRATQVRPTYAGFALYI